MKNSKYAKSLLSAAITAALLTGCSTVKFEEVKEVSESRFQEIKSTFEQGRKMAPKTSSISHMDGFYVSEKPFKLEDREILPSFFNEQLTFSSPEPTSFQRLTSLVSEKIGLRISMSSDATDYLDQFASDRASDAEGEGGLSSIDQDATSSPFDDGPAEEEESLPQSLTDMLGNSYGSLPGATVTFTMKHDGTLSELLDNLTGKVGLFWRWNNNEIEIFRYETANINIDIDAMAQQFTATMKSQTSYVAGNGGDSSQEGREQGMATELSYDPGVAITRLQEVIEKSMLSPGGSVEVLEEFGVVTITDVPAKVKKVKEFLEEMNDMATRQIAIKVDVITVTAKNDASAGFDWDAVYNGISGLSAGFTGDIFEGAGNIQIGVIDTGSAFNGTTGFIKALGQFADVTSHYSGFTQTTNGSIAPITDTVKQDYIKSISTEEGDGEDEAASTTIEIGEAKTGIDMTVLPQITSKDKVSMAIKYDLTELLNMENIVTGDNTINLPTSSIKGSYIKAIIGSGKSYMVSGLSNKRGKADQSSVLGDDSPFGWLLGGRKESSTNEEYSILLVTPYVLQD